MKKLISFVLIAVLAIGILAGCAKEEEKTPILQTVVKGAVLVDSDITKIEAMFEEFDAAFDVLKNDDFVTDDDLYMYAETISDIDEKYDIVTFIQEKISDNIESKTSSRKNMDLIMLSSEIANKITTPSFNLSSEFLNYLSGNSSGEACAEKAVAVVNGCSEFFYGEARLTDADLDSIKLS